MPRFFCLLTVSLTIFGCCSAGAGAQQQMPSGTISSCSHWDFNILSVCYSYHVDQGIRLTYYLDGRTPDPENAAVAQNLLADAFAIRTVGDPDPHRYTVTQAFRLLQTSMRKCPVGKYQVQELDAHITSTPKIIGDIATFSDTETWKVIGPKGCVVINETNAKHKVTMKRANLLQVNQWVVIKIE